MASSMSPPAPRARRQPHRVSIHGRELVDDYRWLHERDATEVRRHLEAENEYTRQVMAATESGQEQLYRELLARIKEDESTVPVRDGDYYYYSRYEQGKPYAIYCRRLADVDAREQLLLDVNALAEGHDYFAVGALAVSPDHRLLAYAYDTAGDESFSLVVKDLTSGSLLEDRIEGISHSLAWAADNRTLFYATLDASRRPFRVHRHQLGDVTDPVVFEESDERFFVSVSVTRSREFLVISSESGTTSEARVLASSEPAGAFRLVVARRQGVEYELDHRGDRFYLRTNQGAKNFRVVTVPVSSAGRLEGAGEAEGTSEPWTEVIAHRPEVTIESIELFRRWLVVVEREAGLSTIRLLPVDGSLPHRVELPDAIYALGSGRNPQFDSPCYRFTYSSLLTPATTFDYHLETRRLEVKKRETVLGGYDREQYTMTRITARAADGVEVPISLVHRRDLELDGSNPCLLYGYGAYGITIEPAFSSLNLTLLERGFVYAIAHVRGGALLGEPWHDAGKMMAKRNSFTDFVAAAEKLIDVGYTTSSRLAIRGGSAGGLLVGAATNLRPDLFAVVLAHVPFVDVINTMLDESLPLTVIEYEEWGNPQKREQFEYMLSYSPYDNVVAGAYPHILVTAGLNDPRVQYWEPAKWVAKLRQLGTGDNLVLLKTDMGAGHGGPSGRYDYLRERAFELAFLFDRLGIEVRLESAGSLSRGGRATPTG